MADVKPRALEKLLLVFSGSGLGRWRRLQESSKSQAKARLCISATTMQDANGKLSKPTAWYPSRKGRPKEVVKRAANQVNLGCTRAPFTFCRDAQLQQASSSWMKPEKHPPLSDYASLSTLSAKPNT